MGYNQSDKDLVLRHLDGVKTVLDYGSQVDYSVPLTNKPLYISTWYESMGIHYDCIDLAGDNGAYKLNLAYDLCIFPEELELPDTYHQGGYDLTVCCGTKEHIAQAKSYPVTAFHKGEINSVYPQDVEDSIKGFYYAWRNQFNLTKIGGKIISVNPKSGSWPQHGYHWITQDFYRKLCELAFLYIEELYDEAACNNIIDGWNVCVCMTKYGTIFPTYEQFSQLPIHKK